MPKTKTGKGKSIIDELYMPGVSVGDGGTAPALIHEAGSGLGPNGKSHCEKALDRAREINEAIAKGPVRGDKRNVRKHILSERMMRFALGN